MDSSRDPLDDDLHDLHDLLARYREAVQPPEASEMRVRRSLQAAVPSWSTPPKPAATGLIAFGARGRRALVFTLSAAAAIALTFGLSSYLGEHRQRSPVLEQSAYTQPEPGTSRAGVHLSATPSLDRAPHPPARGDRTLSSLPLPPKQGVDAAERTPPGAQGPNEPDAPSEPDGASDLRQGDHPRPGVGPNTQSQASDGGSNEGAQSPRRAEPAGEATAKLRGRGPSPAKTGDGNGNDDDKGDDPQRTPAATLETADAPASLDLARELRLIRQAEDHLRAGDGRAALAAIDRHRREFPEGQLEPEREASRVTLLCLQGDDLEAARRAERFAQRWPSSPLLPRVRRVCEPT